MDHQSYSQYSTLECRIVDLAFNRNDLTLLSKQQRPEQWDATCRRRKTLIRPDKVHQKMPKKAEKAPAPEKAPAKKKKAEKGRLQLHLHPQLQPRRRPRQRRSDPNIQFYFLYNLISTAGIPTSAQESHSIHPIPSHLKFFLDAPLIFAEHWGPLDTWESFAVSYGFVFTCWLSIAVAAAHLWWV